LSGILGLSRILLSPTPATGKDKYRSQCQSLAKHPCKPWPLHLFFLLRLR
jgi:hypothetical protein